MRLDPPLPVQLIFQVHEFLIEVVESFRAHLRFSHQSHDSSFHALSSDDVVIALRVNHYAHFVLFLDLLDVVGQILA